MVATFNSPLNVTGEIASPTITSIQSNISSLQGGVSSLQTNVSSLQTNVSSLQNSVANINTVNYASSVSGTANAITANLSPAPTSYSQGFFIRLPAALSNTGACTLNVNSIGAISIKRQGQDLVGGEWKAGDILDIVYDGTNFEVLNVIPAPIFLDRVNNAVGIDTTTLTGKFTINNTPVGGISLDADSTTFNGRNARFPGRLIAGSAGGGYPTISYNSIPSSSTNNSFSKFVGDVSWQLNFGNNSVFSIQHSATAIAGTTFTPTDLFSLTTSGNIGLGTNSPNARMTIQSGASTSAEITMRGNNGSSASEFYVGQGGDGQTYIHNRANTALYLGTNNTTRLTIAANGSFTFAGSVQVNSTLGATGDVGSSGGVLYSQLSTNEGGTLRLNNNGKTGSACYMWQFYNMNSAYTPNGGGGSLQLWRYPASGGSLQTTIWEDNGTMTNNGSLGVGGNIVCSGIIYEDASGIVFRGSTLIGSGNAMGLRWASPNIYGTVDNVVSAVLGTVSDYRLKENFCEQTQAISIIKLLKPGSYNPVELDGSVSNKVHWGLIAHEVEKVIPSLVCGKKDGINENGDAIYQSVDYAGMVPYLVAAIKEQQQQIEKLQMQVQNLV